MARSIRNPNLDSRAARNRLAAGAKHWGATGVQGLHIGYRRGPRGGTWYARRMTEGRYVLTTVGVADDHVDGDGVAVMNYAHALAAAREWGLAEKRRDDGHSDYRQGPYTVNAACDDYLAYYVGKGGKSEYSTRLTIDAHIRPTLGKRELSKLTGPMLRDWLRSVAAAPKRLRTKRGAEQSSARPVDCSDANAMRARRATANRVLNVLKATLNHAWHERIIPSDDAWRSLKPFAAADAPIVRYLSAEECKRLVNTCGPALRNLVRGALLTGARYGELTNLRVGDVNFETGMLTIRMSKSGSSRHVVLTDEARAFFADAAAGLPNSARVFLRDDGKPWGHAHQFRPLREACARAAISPAIGFHILRHTHAAMLAMAGVQMGVIAAQLGHADTRTTSRHYAHLAPSYVAEVIRAGFPAMNLGRDSGPISFRR